MTLILIRILKMKSMPQRKKYIIHEFVCSYQTTTHLLYILLFGEGNLQLFNHRKVNFNSQYEIKKV